jgi:uncharacterized protein YqjF (DUF2071 family)
VRTYVVDQQGKSGVWFFSLDAANVAFVKVARAWYQLPYFRSAMLLHKRDHDLSYASERKGTTPAACKLEIVRSFDQVTSEPGSLAHFLVERYALFVYARGRLFSGEVRHPPYPLFDAKVRSLSESLVRAASILRSDEEPLAYYSPGVDVNVFGLTRRG